ncbi:MAG: SPOR domain-containing protein [Microthrixaceae bacterium]
MSARRFALILASVSLAIFAASFAIALRSLPNRPTTTPPTTDTTAPTTAPPASTPTTAPSTIPTATLSTPAWITIVASERDRSVAEQRASAVADAGYPTGVLHSDDYASLQSGLWVAYAGPYPDRRAADAAVAALKDDAITGAYVRCVGTQKQCNAKDGEKDNGD